MRTLPKFIAAFIVLASFLVFPANIFAASSVLDQYEYIPLPPSADAGYWRINSHTVKQTFKPTKNKLDKVYVYLNGDGSSATVTMTIRDAPANLIGSMSATAPSSANGSWVLFDFSTDLSVTAEAVYQIILTTTPDYPNVYWRIDKTPDYTRGNAVVDGVVKNTDPNKQNFGFLTYGYDAAAPAPPAADPPAATPAPTETSEPAAVSSNTSTTDNKSDAPATETTTTVPTTTTPPVATTSAKTTPKTATSAATTETKGIFQNSLVALLAGALIVLLSGGLVYYLKKKKAKAAPAEVKPTEVVKPTEEVK